MITFLLLALSIQAVSSIRARDECDLSKLPNTPETIKINGQEPLATLHAAGYRVFNCTNGIATRDSSGMVNVTGGELYQFKKGRWYGIGQYPFPAGSNNSQFTLYRDSTDTNRALINQVNLTLDYSTALFISAPDNKSLPWGRWLANSSPEDDSQAGQIAWAARVDTHGGAIPACPDKQNSTVSVPFTTTYHFYACPRIAQINPTGASPYPSSFAVEYSLIGSFDLKHGVVFLSLLYGVLFIACSVILEN